MRRPRTSDCERAGKRGRIVGERERRGRRAARLHRQQRRKVGDVARHRPVGRQLAEEHLGRRARPARGPRWAEAVDVVERRRIAQRAHHVAAVGHRQQAQRHRHRRAAAAAAAGARRVVGAAGRAEHAVVGLRAEPELGGVGLADHDRAGGLDARRHRAVLGRHEVARERRAERRADAGRGDQVLDRDRQAVHPAAALAARELRVARVGLREQGIAVLQRDDRVVRRVQPLDAVERGDHELAARQLRAAIARTARGVELGRIGHGRAANQPAAQRGWRVTCSAGACPASGPRASTASCAPAASAAPARSTGGTATGLPAPD